MFNSGHIALWLGLMVLTACGGGGSKTRSDAAPKLTLIIQADGMANGQQVCQVVVRTTTEGHFLGESYEEIADLVITPDETVLISTPILPGQKFSQEIEAPSKGVLAIYALLTDPQGQWKLLLPAPLPKRSVSYALDVSDLSLTGTR